MASPGKFQSSRPTFRLQVSTQQRFPKRLSILLFSRELAKSTTVRFPVIRASSSSSPSNSKKPSLLKTTCITLTAAAALFSASVFMISKPPTISPEEATLERHLETQPNDVKALSSLTKIKFESSKRDQAIEILNRLIEIEPGKRKWSLMKARILSYYSDDESAIKALEEILANDPTCVEAYHYLVMVYCHSDPKLTELEKRIMEAIVRCKKEKRTKRKKKTKEIRDFRLMIAQIRFNEGNTVEAPRIYEQLMKDDPKDFRIYLFQGTVYRWTKKEDETKKVSKQIEGVTPWDHPLRRRAMKDEKDDWEWRAIVAYDDIFCFASIFSRLLMTSTLGKFGFDVFKRSGNESLLTQTLMFISYIGWFIRSS